MKTQCLFCGNTTQFIFVHGHYQCPVCNTNALPCCDGDNCNNAFLNESEIKTEDKNSFTTNSNTKEQS